MHMIITMITITMTIITITMTIITMVMSHMITIMRTMTMTMHTTIMIIPMHPARCPCRGRRLHTVTVDIERAILDKNDRLAERNRAWFEGREILASIS